MPDVRTAAAPLDHKEAAMSTADLDEFRTQFLPRQTEAEEALIHGELEPRLKLWSKDAPVSVFGAWGPCKTGWDEVSRIFRWVASRFSDPADSRSDFHYDVEVVDVSGDMAYTAGFERFKASRDGSPPEQVTVRVTHVYRRENGEWKIVHRHGDLTPVDEGPPRGD
jgi:ketosteroid isomerase-like protein